MKILGIIAEYNPFHNGHKYLIDEAKKQENFDAVICVMSGNFLQRGEPAFSNKWARAEMAIHNGIDLVIELPFCYATRSAYYFAKGGIELLHRSGIVTHIAFGSENGNLSVLKQLAHLIATEPNNYKLLLLKYLSNGLSFPLARAKTLESLFDDSSLLETLNKPNNILGIEYLRVLLELNLPIIPITIPRKGSGYHSKELSNFASATAIRNSYLTSGDLNLISHSLPSSSLSILEREIKSGRSPIAYDAFEQAILLKLRSLSLHDLEKIYEVSEGLENRIKQAAYTSGTINDLKFNIKTKRYSLTRINRILLNSLLNVTKNMIESFDKYGPLYLHILGFSAKGQEILQDVKNKSQVSILSRGSDIKALYDMEKNDMKGKMIALDVLATDIYTLFYNNTNERKGRKDFTTSPIIVGSK